ADQWLPATTEGAPYAPELIPLRGSAFTADPRHPVRSDDLAVPREGPPDRCLLATRPLPSTLDVAGPARVRLRGTADTPSADWAARLVALFSEGNAERLAVGIVRRDQPPGVEDGFTVELGRIARRLPAGTRLRLEIAGHHFPAHARNPHTGEDPVTAVRLTGSRRDVTPAGVRLELCVLPSPPAPVDPAMEVLR
ncbi:CocE/NonD family hydrolase C-terminal non-catalytic domain-containing protein, partial [Streptomyces sp. UH6]|uniref:CocE/NonD family hydrolase C-terminal non-catalytic domain-containing protein n=1 Tax=Streptomyces sp. UH6 TaxID=2748379 RepID=UPI0017EF77EA